MLINSSELYAAGFTRREVIPPALEAAARGGRRRYGASLHQLQGIGPKRFVLSADNNNAFRFWCKWMRGKSCFCWLKLAIFFQKSRGGKDPFPGGALSSGLGATYLSAVVLVHRSPALSQRPLCPQAVLVKMVTEILFWQCAFGRVWIKPSTTS